MRKIFIFFVITFFLLSNIILNGQVNKDVILLVDVSTSMKSVFSEVQDYFINELIGKKINIGDSLFIIVFYGSTNTIYNKKIESENDLNNLKNVVRELTAYGSSTDIGNALDVLKEEVSKRADLNNEKYVLLLSDGYQNAPPSSKYYSKDGTISHALLENARTIDRNRWKIKVLSIGGREGMKQLAEEMGAEYTEVSETPDKTELTEKTKDLFYKIEFTPKEKLGLINRYLGSIKGEAASDYNRKVFLEISKIEIDNIYVKSEKLAKEIIPDKVTINDKGFSFYINENDGANIKIPVRINDKLKSGEYFGRLKFYFKSSEQFTPTSFPVSFTYPNLFIGNLFFLLLILILLLLLLIFLIRKFGSNIGGSFSNVFSIKGKLKYEFIDQANRISKNLLFNRNEKKSVGGSKSQISIPRIGFNDNMAYVIYDKYGFHLDVLKPLYFRSKIDRDSFLDKEIEVKSISGKTYYIKFSKI